MPDRIHAPEIHVPKLLLVPIEAFNERKIVTELAPELVALVQNPETQSDLWARNRRGTIRRYGISPVKAAENLKGLRNQDHLSAYVVRHAGSTIGMATIQQDLPLYEQSGSWPAAIARRFGLSTRVENAPEYNVSGWIDNAHAKALGKIAALSQIYAQLRTFAPDSWTIESAGWNPQIDRAIVAGGYEPLGLPAMYDELERPGIPPLSQFYISETAL